VQTIKSSSLRVPGLSEPQPRHRLHIAATTTTTT
jgi:hypothetical protein